MSLKPIAAPEDYVLLNTTITFSPNETTQTVLINTNDDVIIESGDVFAVQIVSNSRRVQIRNTGVINITIAEITGKY